MKLFRNKKAAIPVAILMVILLAYLAFSIYFKSHFYFRSMVNGVEASGQSAATVMQELKDKEREYSLTVTDADGNETLVLPDDVKLDVQDAKADLDKLIASQSGFGWVGALIKPVSYESKLLVSYDEGALLQVMSKLPAVTNTDITPTKDAKLVYDDHGAKVEPEVYGNEVDLKALKKNMGEAITNMTPRLDLTESKSYVQPTVFSDDEALNKNVDALNEQISMNLTYDIDGDKEVVSKETMASWLKTDKKGNLSYDEDAIRKFVSEMAEKYNTVGKPMTIHSVTGSDIEVGGGSYGYKIDQDGEVEQLMEDLKAKKDVTRDFVYSQTAYGGRKGPGNLYIEVNRTGQHFWVIKNGEVVLESPVVTGNPNTGHQTHCGTWYIQFKKSPCVLNGVNDDGTEYHTKVSYWMHFFNGEGFHDATWQPSFGGNFYLTRGSHGCVNLPLSVAGKLYDIVEPGVPVFIYDLPGTEDTTYDPQTAQAMIAAIDQNAPYFAALTPESSTMMAQLWSQWNALTPNAQGMVTNAQALIDAHNAMNAIRVANGIPTD